VTEAGTKGSSAFCATSSLPSASITSTSPDGASAATFSLAPAKAYVGGQQEQGKEQQARPHAIRSPRRRASETIPE
jgi:hypothetical protein